MSNVEEELPSFIRKNEAQAKVNIKYEEVSKYLLLTVYKPGGKILSILFKY